MADSWVRRLTLVCAPAAFAALVLASCRDAAAPGAATPIAPTTDQVVDDDGLSIASNQWLTLPSLSQARSRLAVVKYMSCIWAIGGEADAPLGTVERYCPGSQPNQWTAGPSLPAAIGKFGGVGVIAKKIYVAGGLDVADVMRRSLYVYDQATGWMSSPDSVPFPVACGGNGTVVNGKLYIYATKPVDPVQDMDGPPCQYRTEPVFAVYDPAKASPPRWRVLPIEPPQFGGTTPPLRCDHAIASVGTMIYLVGGAEYCEAAQSILGVAAFNTVTEQWLPDGQVPTPNEGRHAVAALGLNGRLFAFGGFNGYVWYGTGLEAMVYDPATNAWDQLRPLITSGVGAGVAALGTRITLVGGGGQFPNYTGWPTGTTHVTQLNVPSGCDVHEPDGAVATANPWTLRTNTDDELQFPYRMTQARICASADVDLFVVNPYIYTGAAFHIEMTPPAGRNYQLQLLTPNGQTVVATSANPGSQTESVLYPPNVGPGYIVRVKTQGGSFDKNNPYLLEVVP